MWASLIAQRLFKVLGKVLTFSVSAPDSNTIAIAKEVTDVHRWLEVGAHYKHFKGDTYCIVKLAYSTMDKGLLVVYHSLSDPSVTWARPAEEFLSQVHRKHYYGTRFRKLLV